MKPRLRHLVAVAIVALTTIPSGWAQGPPPGRPEGGPVERFHEPAIPGLNADQTRRIRELREESGSKLASLGLELRNYRRSLETLYRSYQLDVNAARRLNRQINDVQKRMLEQHLRVETEMRAILNVDQFRWLKEHMPGGGRFGEGGPERPRR